MMGRKQHGRRGRWRDQLSERMASGLLYLQRSWSVWMTRRFSKMGRLGQLATGLLFAAVMITASLHAIVSAYHNPGDTNTPSSTMSIPMPLIDSRRDSRRDDSAMISSEIQKFENYMDSLGTTAEGRKIMEQFFKDRPGLRDSIERVKEWYGLKPGGWDGIPR